MTHWYRNIVNLLESIDIHEVYHGTTMSLWAKEGDGNLFLTSNKDDAKSYADEASSREYYNHDYDEENTHDAPEELAPILVVFNLKQLESLGLEFEPDWGGSTRLCAILARKYGHRW